MLEDDSDFLKPPKYDAYLVINFEILTNCRNRDFPPITRFQSVYNPLHTFDLPKGEQRHYIQQYADMYFLRLAMLKPTVEQIAVEAWDAFQVRFTSTYDRTARTDYVLKLAGEKAKRVDRVLDVRQGELSWVVGTVYMDMPMKPNVLDDISKEASHSESDSKRLLIL